MCRNSWACSPFTLHLSPFEIIVNVMLDLRWRLAASSDFTQSVIWVFERKETQTWKPDKEFLFSSVLFYGGSGPVNQSLFREKLQTSAWAERRRVILSSLYMLISSSFYPSIRPSMWGAAFTEECYIDAEMSASKKCFVEIFGILNAWKSKSCEIKGCSVEHSPPVWSLCLRYNSSSVVL